MNKSEKNNSFSEDILNQLPTPVMAIDKDFKIIFMNKAGLEMTNSKWEDIDSNFCFTLFDSDHCKNGNCRMKHVMNGESVATVRNIVYLDNKPVPIEYTADVLRNKDGEIIGGLEYIIDISEVVKKEEKLKEQSRTILEISTPVIQLWDRILVLPIVGVVDSYRAQQMMDTMLNKLKETSSKIIILDIQGVATVDTAVANHLIKIAKATRLMGCKCIISGISPSVAQTLVTLGVELGTILTHSNLQEALGGAFSILDLEVSDNKKSI